MSHQRHQSDSDVVLRGVTSGLLPSVDVTTLNFWGLLFADLQRQLLNPARVPNDDLVMSWADCRKLIGSQDGASLSRLAAALEQLASLRFSVPDKSAEPGATFGTVQLFGGEQWVNCNQADKIALILKPSPYAIELLTGYADGYVDLVRGFKRMQEAKSLLSEIPPLVLWKPVWLELSGQEQMVYLRMEKSMQWEMAWLQLDGVIGSSMDALFLDLKMARRATSSGSPLMERLRLLGRLGRKLVAHGVISRETAEGYFALSESSHTLSQVPMIVWQASVDRLRSFEEQSYFGRAAQTLLRLTVEPAIDDILTLISVGVSDETSLKRVKSVWASIKDRPGCALRSGPASIIQSHILFLELGLRQMTGHRLPLPKKVLSLPFVKACSFVGDVTARFDAFVSLCGESPDVARCLLETPDICVASPGYEFSADYTAIMSDVLNARQSSVPSRQKELSERAPKQSETTSSQDLKSGQSRELLADKRDPIQAKLRKLAHEELERMMKGHFAAYQELQASYFKSLDESSRQLMLDIQRRMQPKVFEEQLKERLVRFMVDHPANWKSSTLAIQ